VATSLVLFLPDSTIAQLGLEGVRETYRMALGLTFVGSASLVVVHALFAVPSLMRNPWINWRYRSAILSHLRALTAQEKQFLRPYIINGETSRYASVTDGVANSLKAKGVVYRASNITVPGQPGMQLPYNLQPCPRKVLNRKRWLLDHPAIRPARLQWLSDWTACVRQLVVRG
jgi:hypothetical protein